MVNRVKYQFPSLRWLNFCNSSGLIERIKKKINTLLIYINTIIKNFKITISIQKDT